MRLLWWAIPLGVVLGVVGAFVISRALFGHDDPSVLRALKADPMARYVPPHVVARLPGSESDRGVSLGQPDRAELTREFRMKTANGAEAYLATLKFARKSGWRLKRFESATSGSAGSYGSSEALFDGKISVSVEPDPKHAQPGEVILGWTISASPLP